jgi:hypothetical protein
VVKPRCVNSSRYQASLIPGKVYKLLPDPRAAKDDLVRIVDESGEDYLYHKSHFAFVDFPPAVRKRLLALGSAA